MANQGVAPAVSVVIPAYNHGRHVMETLHSVFAQSFRDFEVIVIDDGSPDDTSQVLRPLAESGKIRYTRQENRGQAAARNAGLRQARGEFIALLDDDDLWPVDKLAWQVEALRSNRDAVLVYGFAHSFDDHHERLDEGWPRLPLAPAGQVHERFLRQNWIISPGQTLMRRNILTALGGCDESVWGADDWDLYLRLSREGSFLFQQRLALKYRFHGGNSSNNVYRMYKNCRKVMRRNMWTLRTHAQWRAWRAGCAWVRGHYLNLCIRQANACARAGDGRGAARNWAGVLLSRPDFFTRRSKMRSLLETWRLYHYCRDAWSPAPAAIKGKKDDGGCVLPWPGQPGLADSPADQD